MAIAGAIGMATCALGLLAMRLAPSLAAAEANFESEPLTSALTIPRPERAAREVLASPAIEEAVAPEVAPEVAPSVAAAEFDERADAPDETITQWQPAGPRRCTRRHGHRYCDGPLRAPIPHGVAAERAARLGLGTREAWFRALSVEEPEASWLAEIPAATHEEGALLWPVPEGFLGRGFGNRLYGNPHATPHPGLDMPAASGAEVRAAADGLVIYAGDERRGYGNVVLLVHRGGDVTLYAHCRALHVFAGELVERGARLGEVGKRGLAHGNHLHFEWRRRGHAKNPVRHLVGRPDHAAETELANAQRDRRREGEAELHELRERAERNAALRARRAAHRAAAARR